jgi:hypothetical protein
MWCFPSSSTNPAQPPLLPLGIPTALKGLTMTPQFLRHEAARFRGMADDTDREATKLRLLAMAADYEARAGVANELTDPDPDPGEATDEVVEPTQDQVPKITLGKKIATGLKETVMVQRRAVGRPRRE